MSLLSTRRSTAVSPRPDRASMSFVAALAVGFVMDLGNAYLRPTTAGVAEYVLLAATLILLALTIVFALSQQHRYLLDDYAKVWLFAMVISLSALLAWGVWRENELRLIGPDMVTYLYMFAGLLVGVNAKGWPRIDRYLAIQFGLAAVLSVAAWLSLGVQFEEGRQALSWTAPYIIWGTLFAWPYFLITVSEGSVLRRAVAVIGCAVFFVMALFFEKRTPFGHLAVLAVCLLYVTVRGNRSVLRVPRAVLSLVLVVFCAWVVVWILDLQRYTFMATERLQERYLERGSTYATLVENDRLTYETGYVREQLTGVELLIGRGLGGSVVVPFESFGVNRAGWLHNGTATLVLKGGMVFMTIWTIGWLVFVVKFARSRDPHLSAFYIPVVIIFSFSFFQSFAIYNPAFGFLMACAGRCMAKRRTWPMGRTMARPLAASRVPQDAARTARGRVADGRRSQGRLVDSRARRA